MMRRKALEGTVGVNYFLDEYSDATLDRHCAGDEVISASNINGHGMCCWVAFDIDCHHRNPVIAERNFAAALEMLTACPYEAWLEKSNEYGGFHLWMFPPQPITGAEAVEWINGFSPNQFEKRPTYNRRCDEIPHYSGNTLRLPGLKPIAGTWSKMYLDGKWVDVREMQ